MSKYKYSETERQINSVLKHHDEDLKSIHFPSLSEADATVAKADALLRMFFSCRGIKRMAMSSSRFLSSRRVLSFLKRMLGKKDFCSN